MVIISLFLSIGIVLGYFTSFSRITIFSALALSFLVLSIAYRLEKKRTKTTHWFTIAVLIFFICFGVFIEEIHKMNTFKNHFTKFSNQRTITVFKIREQLKATKKYHRYYISILYKNKEPTFGKSLLYIAKDSNNTIFPVDFIGSTKATFKDLPVPLNPYDFNYSKYLKNKNIYQQAFCKSSEIFPISYKISTLRGYANQLKNKLEKELETKPLSENALTVIKALLLGNKKEIKTTIFDAYKNTGVVHILAVSGLHISILLLFLHVVLKPIERFKKGKLIKATLLLFALWAYALLTGLSASVVRATTMFSCVTIALHTKRKTNIFNTLAVSVFILLLNNPLYLFDVGFQLSYLAVLGIVSFHPILKKSITTSNSIGAKIWNILTVTTTAQLGVLPVSLYYFHQFSSLFWISNLVVLPFIGLILIAGFIVLILAAFQILPDFLAQFYGMSIDVLNRFLMVSSSFKSFLFTNISISKVQVFAFYSLLIALYFFLKKLKYTTILALGVAILLVQLSFLYTKYKNSTAELVVFHSNKETLLAERYGKKLQMYTSATATSIAQNYQLANGIQNTKYHSIPSILTFKKSTMLVVDSLGVYAIKGIQPDYVLLINSPKINVNRLLDSLQPKLVIADGSNFKSYVSLWEKTCKKRKHPFYSTSKKGALVIK